MTHRPAFWFAVTLLCGLTALTLWYRAPGVTVADCLAFGVVGLVVTVSLFTIAGRLEE